LTGFSIVTVGSGTNSSLCARVTVAVPRIRRNDMSVFVIGFTSAAALPSPSRYWLYLLAAIVLRKRFGSIKRQRLVRLRVGG